MWWERITDEVRRDFRNKLLSVTSRISACMRDAERRAEVLAAGYGAATSRSFLCVIETQSFRAYFVHKSGIYECHREYSMRGRGIRCVVLFPDALPGLELIGTT